MNTFDKVIGYDYVKKEMYKVLDIIKNPEKYKKAGIKIPKGILLDGEPGVGKSLLAASFIEASGLKAYTIRKDKPDGMLVNHIRKSFKEAAENAPSIIFLDDMDKFANESRRNSNAEEYVAIQACIDEVKNKDVFVIATTNEKYYLPDSLTRSGRFDIVFEGLFPREEDSAKIIDFYLKDKMVDESIDIEEIARLCRGYSCAKLETLINMAGLSALYEGHDKINQEDFVKACLHEIYGINDESEPISEQQARVYATHEAGHVVVAEFWEPGTVDFASINTANRSDDGGMVSRTRDHFSTGLGTKESEIMISLAGKAAIEITSGESDIGANNDLQKAHELARKILDDYSAYTFDSWCHGDETSQMVYSNLDRAIAVELSRYYMKTKKILIENRAFLDAITEALITDRTITYKTIEKIKKNVYGDEEMSA